MAIDPEVINQSIADRVEMLNEKALESAEQLRSFIVNYTRLDSLSTLDFEPNRPGKIGDELLPTYKAIPRPDLHLDRLDPERFKTHVFVSPFFDSLSTQISSIVLNGGVGVGEAVQTAIFNQGKARLAQIMNDELDAANGLTARNGFDIPTSMTYAARDAVIQRNSDRLEDLNNKIIEKMADLARQNIQDAMAKGIQIEQIHADFTTNFARVFHEVTTAIVSAYRAEIDAAIAEFDGELRGIAAKIDLDRINADLDIKYQDLLLGQFRAESDIRLKNAELVIRQNEEVTKTRLSAAQSITDLLKAMSLGATGSLNGITSVTKKG